MNITLNGKKTDFSGENIADLIEKFKLNPAGVAVEQNGEIVHREKYKDASLREGDRIEIVTFVGGG
jgi:sulfur carrier protein